MDAHIDFLISQCSQRLYRLKLLHSHGLSAAQLDQITQAIIISRLLSRASISQDYWGDIKEDWGSGEVPQRGPEAEPW